MMNIRLTQPNLGLLRRVLSTSETTLVRVQEEVATPSGTWRTSRPDRNSAYGNKYPHISTNWDTKYNHNHPDRKTHVTKKDRCLVYDSDSAAAQYLYHLLPRSGAVPSRPSCTPSHHRTMPEASKALPIMLQHPLFVNKHITEVEAGHRSGPFNLDETHIVSMGISVHRCPVLQSRS
ncbi:hypothetical protein JB92DRAFT_2838973 [Gautieria morchelliformis]|nr:hypothetical protein JB92DRAFT_2838973 [Gautieria morchelliformis]